LSNLSLLSPGRIGDLAMKNRMMMAPMTRSRAGQKGVLSELAIEYYAQRASGGLIITEGIAPSAVGLGYARTPAIEDEVLPRKPLRQWVLSLSLALLVLACD
jgi:N-ethylmaleimide reductase